MQIIDRKSLASVQTSLLIKLKNTLLRRIDITKNLGKEHTRMLLDVLCEIDQRKDNKYRKLKYIN
jgi:hypothetical protein